MKSQREQIAGWCVHYRGMHFDKTCKAGVAYDSIRDASGARGSFRNLPCFAGEGRLPCAHRSFPTDAEIDAQIAESDRAIEAIGKARRAITSSVMHRRGSGGSIDCPVCGVLGALVFSVAHNGHIHAGCRTAGCVAWME